MATASVGNRLTSPTPCQRPARFRHDELPGILGFLRRKFPASVGCSEHLHAIYFDSDRRYLADIRIGKGGAARLSLRAREVFTHALRLGAHGMIMAHNHPSDICRPSAEDIDSTRRLADISAALDIVLLDHVIVTSQCAYSMHAGGYL